MSSESTSSTPGDSLSAAPRQRGRLRWSRRVIWALVCLVSVTVLYYQWENWRGARELGAAWQRLVARVGTDDPIRLTPPTPPDSLNYFAIPAFEQWVVDPASVGSPFPLQPAYRIPEGAFMPRGFIRPESIDQNGRKRFDLDAWAHKRASAGHPLPVGENPAVVLDRELGDGNGLLPQLVAGLDRPFSQTKPGWREALVSAGDQPWTAPLPWIHGLFTVIDDLAVHLRAAAESGNITKAREVVRVMLRWCEGVHSRGATIDCVFGMGMSEITFDALQDALACPVWDDRTLSRLQMEIHKMEDVKQAENALCADALVIAKAGTYVRSLQAQSRTQELLNQRWLNGGRALGRRDEGSWDSPANPMYRLYAWSMNHCPAGIHDANAAFLIEQYLQLIGPRETHHTRQEAADRAVQVTCFAKAETKWRNPRRLWGSTTGVFLSDAVEDAPETLFHRRCVIIACALERYRITHGAFPASLDQLQKELGGLSVNDPARPERLPGYRQEKGRYVLWSVGDDRKDDGGRSQESDWLWPLPKN